VRVFSPARRLRLAFRDHRKILVVDDAVGFVGGYNIGEAYATEWRDTHVRITGPCVWDNLGRLLRQPHILRHCGGLLAVAAQPDKACY